MKPRPLYTQLDRQRRRKARMVRILIAVVVLATVLGLGLPALVAYFLLP